jgi:hypothetical protein
VDEGDGSDAPRPKPGPWRAVLLSLAGAAVFAALLGASIVKSVKLPEGPVLVPPSEMPPPGPDTLALAQRIGDAFVGSLRAGDLAGAYAQMARPYREGSTLAAFQAAWGKTAFLASCRSITFTRATDRATPIDGRLTKVATFTATGTLVCATGPLETTFIFLREGDEAHVLAVLVNGIPVVQGIGPNAAAR